MLGKKVIPQSDSVIVVGLGRFGRAVAQSLAQLGHEVLGVDDRSEVVQELSGALTHVVQANSTSVETLRQLSAGDFSHAVVAIGSDLEASVLTVLALSELGVPDIWAKAVTERHGRILERTGAHHVVYPEKTMGERVAHLVTSKIIDFIEFDDDFAIAKTRAPADVQNKTLAESELRRTYNVTIVGIKRPGEDFTYGRPDTMVRPGDLLIVAGPTREVEAFAGKT
ncbi:MAG: TrkA family potassium uptake protein [Cypionkella sp.]|uniref:potassium channel family protein n=1 Tax=Cypionkella sp. TaxID=2811411 RepID=UPI002727E59C|nr:TrkA family potassium uptake protein [Cypionkella sp.]MDO8326441.1 TrkA family potassium uptake protein [Cypionkella sp.]